MEVGQFLKRRARAKYLSVRNNVFSQKKLTADMLLQSPQYKARGRREAGATYITTYVS